MRLDKHRLSFFRRCCIACMAAALWHGPPPAHGEAKDPAPKPELFDLVRLLDVQIDGQGDDWTSIGLHLGPLGPVGRKAAPDPEDLSGTVSMAWDDLGLLARIEVKDDAAVEKPGKRELYLHDSVEIFLAPSHASDQKIQCIVAPGVAEGAKVQIEVKDHRTDRELRQQVPLRVEAAATAVKGGYVVEVRLPWAAVGIAATTGLEAVAQVLINDVDPGDAKTTLAWYPRADTYRVTAHMHRLRLISHHNLSWVDAPMPATGG